MRTTKTAVVTGGTSGLGEAAAKALAAAGYAVVIIGRDAGRGEAVVAAIRGAGREASFVEADLFTVRGARSAARAVLARTPRVDLLVNNAGATFGEKRLTRDGLERTFALNVVAPFVLTEELMPALAAQKGRVVNVVTGIRKGAKATVDQLVGDAAGAGIGAYARAKLALCALTAEQQRRHGEHGVTFVSLHPGIIPGTRFGQDMPAFVRAFGGGIAKVLGLASTLEDAAARYVSVGAGDVTAGAFYDQGEEASAPSLALDSTFGREVWDALVRVTGAGAAMSERASPMGAPGAMTP